MKNEALLGAYKQCGAMTPSPNQIVRKNPARNLAAKGGNEFAAICRNLSLHFAAFCSFLSLDANLFVTDHFKTSHSEALCS
jgi:hypothetical protein